jgi:peptidyl-prolyl cis-trans isomerase D
MIQLFRSRIAKQIAVIVFAALMVIFLLTSVDLSAFFGGGSVGSINGRTVDARNYEALVSQQTQLAQQNSPTPLSLEDVTAIRDQVWDQLVQQSVLEQEYRRYGLTATDAEVAAVLQQNPPQEVVRSPEFQTDGQFDLAKYQRWLTAPTSAPYVEALASQIREQIRRNKLLTLVTADVYVPDPALWERFRDQHETVRATLTAIVPRNVVPDSAVRFTPADVEAYFREHAEEFSRERVAYLSAVTVPRILSAADSAAVRQRAAEARQEIAGGVPFEEVARRESADPVSAERGGDLGQWVRGMFDPAFDSVAFRIPLNTVSEPVLSSFGYHLIEVTARSGDTASGRHILYPIELSGDRRDALDRRLDTLDRIAAGQVNPEAFDSVAALLGLEIVPAEPVQYGGRAQVGSQLVPDAAVWAFLSEVGEISDVIETPDAFYLFRLDSLHDQRTPTLAQVRGAVEAAVRNEKRFEVAQGIARNFLRRVQEGSTPAQAASALGVANTTVGPFARVNPPLDIPEVVGAAFGVPVGGRSDVITTDEGLYVIGVLERTPADSAQFVRELEELRGRAVMEVRQARVRNFLASLSERAEVEDRREEFLRRQAQLSAQALGT